MTNVVVSRIERVKTWLLNPPMTAPRATVLVRLMAGAVFLSEGIIKFAFANQGVGRFTKLGFPHPAMTASFIGGLEIVGGCLLLAGLLTRLAALTFVIEMVVAILATKVSLYLGTSPLPLPLSPPRVGFWAVMHESRSDWAQLLTCLYLAAVGPGPWSLAALVRRRRARVRDTRSSAPHLGVAVARR
jgi:putative oxidoreductase